MPAFKVGIVGYAGAGKTTVFQWLTDVKPDPGKALQGQTGVAKMPDARLDFLTGLFKPKKSTPTTLDFLDTPGLMPTERRDNPRRLAILRESNGLLVILNGYSEGDLAGQLRRFREELVFADLEIVGNRISKLKELVKKARPAKQKEADEAELATLQRLNDAYEGGQSAASLEIKPDEEKTIRSFQLLTLKTELVLVNCGDDLVGKPLPADLLALAPNAIAAPAKLELDLADLPMADRLEMMSGYGMTGFVRDATLRSIFTEMGQQVFFTVGEDECRAWTIPAGADAVIGASQIHTDLADKFVRAEVVGYDDFVRVGSLKDAKTQGVYRLEGKTYIVKDGDIMHILASR